MENNDEIDQENIDVNLKNEKNTENEQKTNDDESNLINYQWKEEEEEILREWADKAMCYRWLHSKSNIRYSHKNAWYTIPVIIISTLTGTANFAMERIPEDYRSYFSMSVGSLNLLTGIISTIAQFLKISELNESHRVASIAWGKFNRNIKVELAKNPEDRLPVSQVMKLSREEYDRLVETSPEIPQVIISRFLRTFNNYDIIKPEICDELETTKIFDRSKIKIVKKKVEVKDNFEEKLNTLVSKFKQMKGREPKLNELNEMIV